MVWSSNPALKQAQEFYKKELSVFVGGTITAVEVDAMDGQPLMGFTVRCKDGKLHQIIALRDEEGNGPGVLHEPWKRRTRRF